jgi:hypothetical protein
MKTKIITTILTTFFAVSAFAADVPAKKEEKVAAPVTTAKVKEVCHDKVGKDGKPVNGKDGKVQQDCKKIKVHEKLEGTPVPAKK